ncbi:MAG: methyltransferase domain-containing protein [Candidatus Methylomirabilis oxyfera]|nr:methyltransferase domain-containing protein [Candidatus Methylomirabilis oxyfera]
MIQAESEQSRLSIPLPPKEFMKLVSGDRPDLDTHFEEVGRELVRWLRAFDLVGPDVTFLDIGCGCGRIARVLACEPLRAYVGFDRHPEMIRWCQEEITSRAPHFQFHCFGVKSAYWKLDGHQGSIDVSGFRFPFRDCEFDTCLASSVFTHMPLAEVDHYLSELHRVLRPGGRLFASIFCSRKEPCVQEANYYHDRSEFIRTVERHGFAWSLPGPEGYGDDHNWYLLTRPRT